MQSKVYICVSRALSTCVMFCDALNDFAERFLLKNEIDKKALVTVLKNAHYVKMISKFEQIFDAQLQDLILEAKDLVALRHEHVLNILLDRLDYNSYFDV